VTRGHWLMAAAFTFCLLFALFGDVVWLRLVNAFCCGMLLVLWLITPRIRRARRVTR